MVLRARPFYPWSDPVDFSATGSFTDTFDPAYLHCSYKWLIRADAVATFVNMEILLQVAAGLDAVTADYHWQRSGASNGAATIVEGTTFDCFQIAAGTAVSGYYSPVYVTFPFFAYGPGTYQRSVLITAANEFAAQNQQVMFVAHKRQSAGAVGALTDALVGAKFQPASNNFLGTYQKRFWNT